MGLEGPLPVKGVVVCSSASFIFDLTVASGELTRDLGHIGVGVSHGCGRRHGDTETDGK